jgi:archaellum component FlaC
MSEIQNIKELIDFIDNRFVQFLGHFDIQSKTVGTGIESIKKEIVILEQKLDEIMGRVIGVEKDVCRNSDEIEKAVDGERIKFDHVWNELRRIRDERTEILEKEKREVNSYAKVLIRNEILTLKVWALVQGFAVLSLIVGFITLIISKKF